MENPIRLKASRAVLVVAADRAPRTGAAAKVADAGDAAPGTGADQGSHRSRSPGPSTRSFSTAC